MATEVAAVEKGHIGEICWKFFLWPGSGPEFQIR